MDKQNLENKAIEITQSMIDGDFDCAYSLLSLKVKSVLSRNTFEKYYKDMIRWWYVDRNVFKITIQQPLTSGILNRGLMIYIPIQSDNIKHDPEAICFFFKGFSAHSLENNPSQV